MVSYRVEVSKQVRTEIRDLPGNMRQRVVRALEALREEPYPSNSRALNTDQLGVSAGRGMHVRRIRIGVWRVLYLIEEADQRISILGIRKRPPYQYEDMKMLIEQIQRRR